MQNTLLNFFVALQQTNVVCQVYKYSNFRNQEIIDNFLEGRII
jgi:hypothetical protein